MIKPLKDRNKFINQYIIDCIYNPDNPGIESLNDRDKLKYLYDTFLSEKWNCENIKQYHKYNMLEGFRCWIQGLPSSFNIEWENFGVLELAKQQGALPDNPTDKERLKILDNYWHYMASKTFQLFIKHKIIK